VHEHDGYWIHEVKKYDGVIFSEPYILIIDRKKKKNQRGILHICCNHAADKKT
jgi:hypothetical protein